MRVTEDKRTEILVSNIGYFGSIVPWPILSAPGTPAKLTFPLPAAAAAPGLRYHGAHHSQVRHPADKIPPYHTV